MATLQSLDVRLFRAINGGLSNSFFDWLMPIFAWNAFFVPVLFLLAIGLLWKGGPRGRIFVFLLALTLALGDGLVINTLKHALARPRPYQTVPDLNLLVGYGRSASMPSSHTATWFAGMLIAYAFYRRSVYFMLPMAVTMAFSRVYVGAHFPSDVLAGAVLGMGYAAAGIALAQLAWRHWGRSLAPQWFEQTPVLIRASTSPSRESKPLGEASYLRLGWLLIAVVFVVRLFYLGSDEIDLSEDEAYQWLWSKHLALSYYSKPPLIAYTQFLGTSIFGDTEFGVRFFSPVLAAVTSGMALQFTARHATARAGFWLVAILNCTPMLAVGATLLTVDPLLVTFWTAAMLAGWRALSVEGRTADWCWAGLWMGLGFLSKYTAAVQIACFGIYFLLRREARVHLRRAGPYLALLIVGLCTIPVLVWNAQHGWITVEHVASNAARSDPWRPTLKYFGEFVGAELGLLNPIFFLGMIWAMAAFWRARERAAVWDYCFCMGAPVFVGYLLFTFYKRVFPNWIAASVVPLFCLMVFFWNARASAGSWLPRRAMAVGLGFGALAVVVLHDTDLTRKLISRTLPAEIDPLRRVRNWTETARVVGAARDKLLGEGKPVFVMTVHYGMAGELSFYLDDAKAAARAGKALVYTLRTETPESQFYFWPGYSEERRGQNAIFVSELGKPKFVENWFWKWVKRESPLYVETPAKPAQLRPELVEQFESVSDLGVWEVKYRGRVFRRLQLFACRNLR